MKIPEGRTPVVERARTEAPADASPETPASTTVLVADVPRAESGGDVVETSPKRNAIGRAMDRIVDKVKPKIVTRETEMWSVGGDFYGVQVGFTVSQLQLIKKHSNGVELNSMIGNGYSAIEVLLGRKYLGHGQRIELQGPSLQASLVPGEVPLGGRFIGVDLTSDMTSGMDNQAASYTIEMKLTEKTVLDLAADVGPGAAAKATELLLGPAGDGVAHAVGHAIMGAVPIVSGALAVLSVARAIKILRNPEASVEMKAFAVAHAVFDTVRVFVPIVGAVGGALLVASAVGLGYQHMRHAPHHEIVDEPVRRSDAEGPPSSTAPPTTAAPPSPAKATGP